MFKLVSDSIRLSSVMMASAMFFPISAYASCGAAFCPVNTQWNTQGMWTEPGWRADWRYEFVPQNQPRSGSSKVSVGQIARHHDEIKTINRNWLATLDYGFANGSGVTLTVPVADRSHSHVHNHMGADILGQWSFDEIGDVQLLGRYQFRTWDSPYVFGITFGAKLPTGRVDVRNGDGAVAERTLQPGTGTTDGRVGVYFQQNAPHLQSSWFMQAQFQQPFNERDEYKPGETMSVDAGYRYDVRQRVTLMLQVNGQYKDRDSGLDAEPRDSGGYAVSLSPGVSYGITETVQLYGFVQKPVFQYVNGVQLTSDWSVVSGLSLRF